MGMYRRLGWFFKQEWVAYVTGIVMLLAVAILSAFIPMITATIIDAMTSQTLTWDELMKWLVVLASIAIVQYGMRYVWRTKIFGTAAKLEQILRQRLFDHLTAMDATFYQKYRTGDLMAHATNDLNAVRMVAGPGILTLVDSLSQGLTTLLMMFLAVDWRLSLLAIIPFPIITVVFSLNGRKVHYYFRRAQEAFSSLNDKVQESVTGVKVIKTFGEEELDIEDFEHYTQDVVDKNKDVYRYDAFFRPVVQLVMGFANVITLFYGGYLVMQGELSIGLLVAFFSYIGRMTWPMVAVGRLFNILERGSASYNRIESLLREEAVVKEMDHPVTTSIAGNLSFRMESFTYPKDDAPTLIDVNFDLPQGHTLGIVGKTGAGKTTIFKLLLRDFDHYLGKITYNGVNIKDYSFESLLGSIGYVPQDNFLFSDSVGNNIRFGNMELSQAEVEEAAQLVDVHDDIMSFVEGYDTPTGERGVSLSGGQQQRVSMARALILDPELLILDDSLSAVDAATEETILKNLKTIRQNKSTIIASHRMSSLMHADEIIVLDEGTITERGTHEELIQLDGWYALMYKRQQLEADLEGGSHA